MLQGRLSPFPRLPRPAPGEVPTIPVAECIKDVRPYEPVQSLSAIALRPDVEPLKLDWNESTIQPSPKVAAAEAAFVASGQPLNWYPDLTCGPLVEQIAEYAGVPADHVLVTNGSDDALDLICKTYLNPDDRVVLPYPTYTHFLVFAGSRGARFDPVTYDDPFVGQPERVVAALTPWTKVVYLVNPNNPTGMLFSREEVLRIAGRAPLSLTLVDEAYYEFAGVSVTDLVPDHPNLVVTRTFSKSFGIAGLRIGYVIAHPQVLKDLRRVFNPKSVNALGQVAAAAALEDLDYHAAFVDEVRRSRVRLVRWLEARGLEARNSEANWILVKVPDPKSFCRALEREMVFVRDRSGFPQLAGWVRMSVGTLEQTELLCERLGRVLAAVGLN